MTQQSFDINLKQTQRLVLTPGIRQSLDILSLRSIELEELIKKEALDNPMLELDYSDFEQNAQLDSMDYERAAIKNESLEEYVREQIAYSDLEGKELGIALYLLGFLDDNGYLKIKIEDASNYFKISLQAFEKVLGELQSFEPSGIFARDLKECITLQLKNKELYVEPISTVIENYFNLLIDNKLSQISKLSGIDVDKIQGIFDLVKTLNPKPGKTFSSKENIKYIVPDVFVRIQEDDYTLEFNDSSLPKIGYNDYYIDLKNSKDNEIDVQKYLNDKYNNAKSLIQSVAQRKETICKITNAIVDYQSEYFSNGIEYLKPLTLEYVSKKTGLSKSTVSRAVNGKYIQTSDGTFELKFFFSSGIENKSGEVTSSKAIKKMIQELVSDEDAANPLSDQKISDILVQKGINISRRTVAKYREAIGINSSQKRKRF